MVRQDSEQSRAWHTLVCASRHAGGRVTRRVGLAAAMSDAGASSEGVARCAPRRGLRACATERRQGGSCS